MANNMDKLAKELRKELLASDERKPKPYDTQAEVIRVEDGIAWVHIPGGVEETPVKLTIDANKGDTVNVHVANGDAWIIGNGSRPPTDNAVAYSATQLANEALNGAREAKNAAENAEAEAARASTAAENAETDAASAATSASDAASAASSASTAASNAATSASNAATAASTAAGDATRAANAADSAEADAERAETASQKALTSLANMEDVVGTLEWITAHGTMTLTSDVQIDPSKVYFVQDQNGDYVVGGQHYSIVSEPDVAYISTYYELDVDESIQNYVATHVAVDTEGLWIIPDSGGHRVLIATGAGSRYTQAGTYIIDKVNNVDVVLAKFGSTTRIGKETAGNGNVVTSNTGMDLRVGTTTVGSLKQITNYTPSGSSETYDNVLQMHATEYFQLTSDYENSGVSKLIMETNATEGVRFHIYDEVEIAGETYIEPASSLYLGGGRTGSIAALSGYIDTSQSYTNIGYSVVASDLDTHMDYGPMQFGINNWNGDVAGGIWSNRLDNWLLGMTFGGALTLRGKPLTDWVVASGRSSATYGSGSGYWRWCEWASGKVELWYNGSMSVDNPSSNGGVYRRYRRVTFPNKPGTNTPYSLSNCMGLVSGTSTGGWLNTGGLFNSSGQNSDSKTQIEVMAYRISSSPDALQGNVNIYICGMQAADD